MRRLRFTKAVFALVVTVSGWTLACGSSKSENLDGGPCGDTTSDPANCGKCGNACKPGAACEKSACVNVAESLTGLRWELSCTNQADPCTTKPQGASASEVLSVSVAGTTGTTYDVSLHFRGVVEPRTYPDAKPGGATGAASTKAVNPQYFVKDSEAPSTGDPENIYALNISEPPQVYYLNSGLSSDQYATPLDYAATLPMTAGAKVTLTANPVDGLEWDNSGMDGKPVVVTGVPPAPKPFNGQFVQMDVTGVAAAK